MKFKQFFQVICLVVISQFAYAAESFLAEPTKKIESKKLKEEKDESRQEIFEILAQILDQKSKIIEIDAKIQQVTLERLKELGEDNKKTFFARAKKNELDSCIEKLKEIKERDSKYLKQFKQDFEFISSGCNSKKSVST